MENIKNRKAQTGDTAKLLAIYAPYVKETAISFECEVPTLDEFMQRMKKIKRCTLLSSQSLTISLSAMPMPDSFRHARPTHGM